MWNSAAPVLVLALLSAYLQPPTDALLWAGMSGRFHASFRPCCCIGCSVFLWRRPSGWPSPPPSVVPVLQITWSSSPCCTAPCRDFCASSFRGCSLLRCSGVPFPTLQCVAPTLSFTLSLLSGRRAELTSSTSCLCTGHLLPSLVLSPRLLTLLFHTSRL